MKTAFITGGNRGIGLSLCEKLAKKMGYKVYMGCRDLEKGKRAIEKLGNPENIVPIVIDVEYEESIKSAYETYLKVKEPSEKLNLFINNAAAQLDWVPNGKYMSILEIPSETMVRIYKTNTIAPVLTTKYFVQNMVDGGSIVNVGTGAAELWHESADQDLYGAYGSSKLASVMITKKLAAALKDRKISVNIACPGWCKTDMGGDLAPTGPEVGAESFLLAAFLDYPEDQEKPTGRFYRSGELIPTDVYPYIVLCPPKVSFLQKVFSLKRERNHKILRILGFKVKWKSKKKNAK